MKPHYISLWKGIDALSHQEVSVYGIFEQKDASAIQELVNILSTRKDLWDKTTERPKMSDRALELLHAFIGTSKGEDNIEYLCWSEVREVWVSQTPAHMMKILS